MGSNLPDIDIPEIPLPEYLLQTAKDRLDKPALIDGPSGRTITYGQLAGATAGGIQPGAVFRRVTFLRSTVPTSRSMRLPSGSSLLGGRLNTNGGHPRASWHTGPWAPYVFAHGVAFLANAKAAAEEAVGGIRKFSVFGEAKARRPFAALLQSDGKLPPVNSIPRRW